MTAPQDSRVEAVREESAPSLANMGASASRGTHAGARSGMEQVQVLESRCKSGYYGARCEFSKCVVPCLNGGVCR